jgi:hypothetical protein
MTMTGRLLDDPPLERLQSVTRRKFLQHCSRSQTRSMNLQPMLQRYRQAIRQKRNHDMGVDPMLQLMIDGANAQLALQTFERRFDLHQLHVTIPQHRRIFRHQVGAQ